MGRGVKTRQETQQHTMQRLEKIRAQRDELMQALKALVAGLDATTWSSWQTTAHFSDEHEAARAAIASVEAAA